MITSRNETYAGSLDTSTQMGTIVVEPYTGDDKTDTRQPQVIRTLANPCGDALNWGYSGGAAHDTSRVILTDFLGHEPDQDMFQAFVREVVSQLEGTWRLSALLVARWVDSWTLSGAPGEPKTVELVK